MSIGSAPRTVTWRRGFWITQGRTWSQYSNGLRKVQGEFMRLHLLPSVAWAIPSPCSSLQRWHTSNQSNSPKITSWVGGRGDKPDKRYELGVTRRLTDLWNCWSVGRPREPAGRMSANWRDDQKVSPSKAFIK